MSPEPGPDGGGGRGGVAGHDEGAEHRAHKGIVFSSRWGLIAATLGMAIGTGNLWRFPRILASNGGGTFLIPWAIFLFTWSVPLLMAEFALGRGARRGPLGAFARVFGERAGWRGGFVAACTLGIMFYYSVVAGWTVRYLVWAVTGVTAQIRPEQATDIFRHFAGSGGSVLFHLICIGVAAWVVGRGVAGGIERACKLLVPALFAVLLVCIVRSLTLDGAGDGLAFLFHIEWERLGEHQIWLEALSQSAWSTGAGWGLMLCYAIYAGPAMRARRECMTTGLGNNTASLLAGLAIIPGVFALAPLAGQDPAALMGESGPASTGLTFIWMPVLFQQMPAGGGVLAILFFLGLAFAALSSLIAMVELGVRTLMDLGHARKRAVLLTFGAGFLLGLPSTLDMAGPGSSLTFFQNQDWVWGVGLMVSGGLLGFSILRFGVRRFWDELIAGPEGGAEAGHGGWFRFCVSILVPLQFVGLLGWWFWQAWEWTVAPAGEPGRSVGERLALWLAPLDTFSVGTCLVQWAVVLGVLILFNKRLAATSAAGDD